MTTIKLRRGTATEWTTANPILAAGEMGIETDTRKFKFGDGATAWNTLPYASTGGGGTGDVTAAGDNKFTGKNTFIGKVNIAGAPLTVDGLATLNQATATHLNATSIISNGEINAVSIKANGIRSDDIQTTTNKNYLSEEDVDNQTIQIVDGKLHANLDELGNEVNDLSGRVTANEADIATKQDKLSDGNGTKINSNKVDINQGTAGIQGLKLYQDIGSITKDTNQNITFDNGAYGYIFLPNKGTNNDYEIVLHCNYLNKRGSASDSAISIVMCTSSTTIPLTDNTGKGGFTTDTYSSPFRCYYEDDTIGNAEKIISTINYQKVIIKGTTINLQVSEDNSTFTDICTVNIDSTNNIIIGISNRLWSADINTKWTNTILYSDSYILDKSTNTYLMKLGITSEGVAVATSTQYGLVIPDGTTIISNDGKISSVSPVNMVTTDTQQNITGAKTFDKIVLPDDITKGIYSGNKLVLYKNTNNINTFLNVTNAQVSNLKVDYGCIVGNKSTGGRFDFYTSTGTNLNASRHDKNNNKIIVGDTTVALDIEATKVLFNSLTLARKIDDSTEATIIDSNNISEYIPQSGEVTIKDTFVYGTSGYRLYSDGFCEQWGFATGSDVVVTLLKPYRDTKYHITLGGGNCYGWSKNSHSFNWYNQTTKTFQIRMEEGTTTSSEMNCNWFALGYVA